jgi:WD40-like Beta Propeller Repeat
MTPKRYSLLLICSLGATLGASAQKGYSRTHSKMLDEARSLYDAQQWTDAAKIYRKLVGVDTTFGEVAYELGMCFNRMPGQRDLAAPQFEQAARNGSIEAKYEVAVMRHRQQRFDEAIVQLNAYRQQIGRAVDDAEVDRRIAMANTAKELTAFPAEMSIRNMGTLINSKDHDYCPIITADGNTMYFTSRREGSTGAMRDPSGQYFEDIYMAKRVDEIWSNATNVGAPLNTFVQDATVGLNPDGSSMIIYRTAQNLTSGDLYECNRHSGLWQPPTKMTDRINSEFHEPSATISPDGTEIYFTSDREGGQGGRDIYRIRKLPNDQWSLPLNLGPTINTPYDEDAPFMHSDGTTLFFSSNGHGTMGGYDIFKSTLVDYDMNGWTAPENMGYPLNTVNDDIYFCLSEDGQTGYFSSERSGGVGGQDIYQITFPSSQLEYLVVRGVITDAGEEPVRARIMLTDAEGDELIGVYTANAKTGRYLMVVQPNERYSMTVEAGGFETRVLPVSTVAVEEGSHEIPLDVVLTRNENQARVAKP